MRTLALQSADWRARAGLATIAALGAALVGWQIGAGHMALAEAFVAALLFVAAATQPEFGILLLLVWIFAMNRLRELSYVPYETRWLCDLVVVALITGVLADADRRRAVTMPVSPFVAGSVLAFVCVASGIVNGMGPVGLLVGTRHYVLPFLLLAAVLGLPALVLRRTLLLTLAITVLQVPVTLVQFIRSGHVQDANSGTLGLSGGQDLVFVCMVALTVFAFLAVRGRRPVLYGLLALSMIVPPLMAGVRAVLLFAPLMLALVVVRVGVGGHWGRGRSRALVAVVVVACLGLASLPVVYRSVVAPNAFTLSYALQRESSSGGVGTGRLAAVREAADRIDGGAAPAALGLGPGVVSESRLRNGQPLTLSFGGGRNQISSTLLETGWAGLVCLFGSAVALVVAGRRRSRPCGDPVLDAVRLAFLPVGVLFVLMFGYFQVWGSYASLLAFMLLLAAVRGQDALPGTAAAARPLPDVRSEARSEP